MAELENIDDDCDLYGIQMVKLLDPQLAKRYGIKTFPALVYFRNGNPLTYEGKFQEDLFLLVKVRQKAREKCRPRKKS